jgi:hypothetical protein
MDFNPENLNREDNLEGIYLTAVEELVKVDNKEVSNPYLFLYSDSLTNSIFLNRKVGNKDVLLIKKEEEILTYVKVAGIILEIEPVLREDDVLTVKINHHLFLRLEAPFDVEDLSYPLPASEKKRLKETIFRASLIEASEKSKVFLSLSQNAWTYVKFKKSNTPTGFSFVSLEKVKI